MSDKHTKGPWEVENDGSFQRTILGNCHIGEEGGRTCTSVAIVHGNQTSQIVTEANSHLIAASPDLLEACQAAMRAFCEPGEPPSALSIVAASACKKAIAKAEARP